jgi:hypothetical protein
MAPAKNLSVLVRTLIRGVAGRPAILLLLGFLCAPLALSPFAPQNSGEDDAEAEGRDYALLPAFPDSLEALRTFPRRFEAFFDDQFPLRLPLVKLSAKIRFRIFNVSPNPAVLIGQDGWFYDGVGEERVQGSVVRMKNHLADHLGQLRYTDAELARWARVLEERRVVLAERGVRYVFAIAPNKRMIYPEHLPEVLKSLKRETRLEQLSRYLAAHTEVPIVDLTRALWKAKELPNRPLLFYKTDGHWNYYGAFVAYHALVDGTNRAFSGLLGPPLELDDFRLEYDERWSHPRFTAQMGLRLFEPYVRLVARDGNPLGELYFKKGRRFRQIAKEDARRNDLSFGRQGVGGILDWPERSHDGTRYRYVAGTSRGKVRKLFVLGDSFIEKAFYLFAANADEVYGYREILGFPDRLLQRIEPDLVIHVIVQSYILNEPPKNPASISAAYRRIKRTRSP